MNKIYRRLWSAARQCWVVASELATARGTRRHTSRGPGLALMLAMLPASVMAATAVPLETSDEEWAEDALLVAFGAFNTSAMLVHEDAGAAASGRALSRANALPLAYSDFVQLGAYAGARDRAVAVGVWAFSNSYGAALGYQANANGQYATALGHQAIAWELGSIAVGNDAKSYGHNAIALGSGALAAGRNSVVLGADSNDYGDNQVSVGNGSMRRKIVYVADGAVDANSSEAVTGRQLYATQQAVLNLSQGQRLLATGTAASSANAAKAVGSRALAMGVGASADGEDTLALGGGARTASGAGVSRIAIGAGAFAGSSGWTGAVALGGSASSTHDGVAIGYQAKTTSSGTTALGRGATATHGNSVALGTNSMTSGANTVSVGSSSNRRRIQYLADGVIAAGSTDAITGNQLHATNASVAAAAAAANAAKAGVDAVSNRLNAEALALGSGALAEFNTYGISTAVGRNAKGYNGKSVALGDDARSGVDKDGNRVANANAGVSVGPCHAAAMVLLRLALNPKRRATAALPLAMGQRAMRCMPPLSGTRATPVLASPRHWAVVRRPVQPSQRPRAIWPGPRPKVLWPLVIAPWLSTRDRWRWVTVRRPVTPIRSPSAAALSSASWSIWLTVRSVVPATRP